MTAPRRAWTACLAVFMVAFILTDSAFGAAYAGLLLGLYLGESW